MHRPVREVDRLAEHVQHAAERAGTDRHRNRRAGVDHAHAALQAVGRLHRHGAHAAFAEVLLDLGDDVDLLAAVAAVVDDADGVVDGRQVPALVLDVDDGTDDLDDLADFLIAAAVAIVLARLLGRLSVQLAGPQAVLCRLRS